MAMGLCPHGRAVATKGQAIQPYDSRMGVRDALQHTRAPGKGAAAWSKERRKRGKKRNPSSPGRPLRMPIGPGLSAAADGDAERLTAGDREGFVHLSTSNPRSIGSWAALTPVTPGRARLSWAPVPSLCSIPSVPLPLHRHQDRVAWRRISMTVRRLMLHSDARTRTHQFAVGAGVQP